MRTSERGLLWALAGLIGSSIRVHGYPMVLEVEEDAERCISYNIPEDDDAHMAFLPIPSPADEDQEENETWEETQRKLEDYYSDQMAALSKARSRTTFPKRFKSAPPDDIMKIQKEFLTHHDKDGKTHTTVTIENPRTESSKQLDLYWFTPLVINRLRTYVKPKPGGQPEAVPLQGYQICFSNEGDTPIQIAVEAVMISEEPGYDDDDDKVGEKFEGSHLTPLAEHLSAGIASARSVIREMQSMERREIRMRKTADSINTRVRYFSYISVTVLLVVAYLQVTYLKRYFHKKKLL